MDALGSFWRLQGVCEVTSSREAFSESGWDCQTTISPPIQVSSRFPHGSKPCPCPQFHFRHSHCISFCPLIDFSAFLSVRLFHTIAASACTFPLETLLVLSLSVKVSWEALLLFSCHICTSIPSVVPALHLLLQQLPEAYRSWRQ